MGCVRWPRIDPACWDESNAHSHQDHVREAVRKALPTSRQPRPVSRGQIERFEALAHELPLPGQAKDAALGKWPAVGLADARAQRDEARKQIAAGMDPAIEKRTVRLNEVDPHTWLADVLAPIAEHPVRQLDPLLPGNRQPQRRAVAD